MNVNVEPSSDSFHSFLSLFKDKSTSNEKDDICLIKKASDELAEAVHRFPPSWLPRLLSSAFLEFQKQKNKELKETLKNAVHSVVNELIISSDEIEFKEMLPAFLVLNETSGKGAKAVSNAQRKQLEVVLKNAVEEWVAKALKKDKSAERFKLNATESAALFSGLHSIGDMSPGLIEKLVLLIQRTTPELPIVSLFLAHSLLRSLNHSFRNKLLVEIVLRFGQVPSLMLIRSLQQVKNEQLSELFSSLLVALAQPLVTELQGNSTLSPKELATEFYQKADLAPFVEKLRAKSKESHFDFDELFMVFSVFYSIEFKRTPKTEEIFNGLSEALSSSCIRTKGGVNCHKLFKLVHIMKECGCPLSVEANMFPAVNILERAILANELKGRKALRVLLWMLEIEMELFKTGQRSGWRYDQFLVHLKMKTKGEGALVVEALLFLWQRKLIAMKTLKVLYWKVVRHLLPKGENLKSKPNARGTTRDGSITLETKNGKVTFYENSKKEKEIQDKVLDEAMKSLKLGHV